MQCEDGFSGIHSIMEGNKIYRKCNNVILFKV